MPALSIHHIGYLVKKIEKARQAFLSLGYEAEQDIVYDHIRKVNICFLSRTDTGSNLSLLFRRIPLSPDY